MMRPALSCGWVVVAVTSAVVIVTAGARSAPGVFLLSMTDEPEWSTATVSFAAANGLFVFGLSGPLSGWLMRRIGVRNVVLASLVITSLSLFATSLVREIRQLTPSVAA
jgi:MFS family permease